MLLFRLMPPNIVVQFLKPLSLLSVPILKGILTPSSTGSYSLLGDLAASPVR